MLGFYRSSARISADSFGQYFAVTTIHELIKTDLSTHSYGWHVPGVCQKTYIMQGVRQPYEAIFYLGDNLPSKQTLQFPWRSRPFLYRTAEQNVIRLNFELRTFKTSSNTGLNSSPWASYSCFLYFIESNHETVLPARRLNSISVQSPMEHLTLHREISTNPSW